MSVLALLAPGLAVAAPLPADLAAAAHAYDQAQVNGDRAALERLVADDYVLVNGAGQVQDKARLIADYVAPGFKLDPFTIEAPVEKVLGDTALLGGRVDMTGTDSGQRFALTVRFVDTWARRDGQWRVVYSQVTRVARP
ncbi:nuclear transport factor 2 family protein [Caulobacter sp. AP07]|uniref:nuclear transport factor 2 family protein n=1 Tax=Caulobacter sp. AP07 TaxID=1144304 RepID=UPI001EE66277|nr:nuclear transport factor 2 family protein [Caulobacter sp. AP07]